MERARRSCGRAIASAIEEADRLSQLAEDLLTLARSDKGRLSIEAQPVEVRDVFAAVRSRLGGPAREAGRSLVVDDPDGLTVEADPARVEQALSNLVENGLRHGNGEIRLWARARDDGVELHVSDAGPGFPPEFLPHAFERFRRADPAQVGERSRAWPCDRRCDRPGSQRSGGGTKHARWRRGRLD